MPRRRLTMDVFDRATRSRVMGRVKSRGTKSTEKRFRSLLVRSGIRGWSIGHDLGLPGRPDFVFHGSRVVVFVDGCFWHGCQRCRSIPSTNRVFWREKITSNRQRDRKVGRALRSQGWKVVRIWEHELRSDPSRAIAKVSGARDLKRGSASKQPPVLGGRR
jgi:DNA mismatch endonuclease, patch repair protein